MVRAMGFVGLGALLVAGCSAQSTRQPRPDIPSEVPSDAVPAAGALPSRVERGASTEEPFALSPAPALGEADIRGVVEASTERQLEQSRLALKRAQSPRVRALAELILAQYQTLQSKAAEATSGSPTTESELSRSLRMGTAVAIQSLDNKSDAEFDRAYLALVVRDLQATLHTLDAELAPVASDDGVRAFIEVSLKPTAKDCLARASELSKELGGELPASREAIAQGARTAPPAAREPEAP